MAGYPLRLPGTPTLSQRRFLLLVFPLISWVSYIPYRPVSTTARFREPGCNIAYNTLLASCLRFPFSFIISPGLHCHSTPDAVQVWGRKSKQGPSGGNRLFNPSSSPLRGLD
ncbi:hypothetical protein K456DRAFT_1064910 [Colletotrichum gloeosporioides 23]|nr:hypothetical protein K456DRAFT_1064910 [Colletotrichum gloeosporioides 23]